MNSLIQSIKQKNAMHGSRFDLVKEAQETQEDAIARRILSSQMSKAEKVLEKQQDKAFEWETIKWYRKEKIERILKNKKLNENREIKKHQELEERVAIERNHQQVKEAE